MTGHSELSTLVAFVGRCNSVLLFASPLPRFVVLKMNDAFKKTKEF